MQVAELRGASWRLLLAWVALAVPNADAGR